MASDASSQPPTSAGLPDALGVPVLIFKTERTISRAVFRPLLVLTTLLILYQAAAQASACAPPAGGGIAICSPHVGSGTVNPVHYIAAASSATCAAGISTMALVSASGSTLFSIGSSILDTFLPQSPGAYTTTVKATDKCGGVQKKTVGLTVAGTGVITYQYNVQRTGANLYETVLNATNVNPTLFGKIFACSVDSFVYGQPLFMPKLSIAGGTHNVVFVATEKNSIYAFDADGKSCTPLWHTNVGIPVPCTANSPVPKSNCNLVFQTSTLGITSTMFIDPTQGAHGVIYVEARTAPASGGLLHGLYKLDLTTGAQTSDSPSIINASIAGNGCDSVNGIVKFNSAAQNERSALLYTNGVIYAAFGSINDAPVCPNGAYHGWILGYSAFNVKQQVTVFNTSRNKTTNGSGTGGLGAIWGGALASTVSNQIFAVTGNGPFDASVGDWGNSYLKLFPSGTTLKVLDYFAPHQIFNNDDRDLGTNTGILVNPSGQFPHELIGGDKNGTLYVVNRDAMGKFNSTDQIVQELPNAVGVHVSTSTTCGPNGASDCDYSTVAYWNGHIYVAGVNDHVKEFLLTNGMLSPSTKSPQTFGYPGATPTISANGAKNAIVWAVEPAKAILHAYDAANLSNELYNTSQNSARDALGSNVKFAPVTVVNGRVYVGTQNRIVGYGLLP